MESIELIRSIVNIFTIAITTFPVNAIFYLSTSTFIIVLIKRHIFVGIKNNRN